jgi:hypothetical protein
MQEGYTLTARQFLLAQMQHTPRESTCADVAKTGFLRVLESDVVSSQSSHTFSTTVQTNVRR